jgi:hypothetical protein
MNKSQLQELRVGTRKVENGRFTKALDEKTGLDDELSSLLSYTSFLDTKLP